MFARTTTLVAAGSRSCARLGAPAVRPRATLARPVHAHLRAGPCWGERAQSPRSGPIFPFLRRIAWALPTCSNITLTGPGCRAKRMGSSTPRNTFPITRTHDASPEYSGIIIRGDDRSISLQRRDRRDDARRPAVAVGKLGFRRAPLAHLIHKMVTIHINLITARNYR
jgi:hypothetical protein